MRKLGRKPDSHKLDYDFWQAERETFTALALPHIRRMAVAGAQTVYDTNPITGKQVSLLEIAFDWTLIAEEAADWAKQHTGELIGGITATTRKGVTQRVVDFLETPGATVGDLYDSLEPILGRTRAEMVAITETTAAYAEGGRVVMERARNAGITVEPVWRTSMDERVCEICGPNEDKPQREGWTVDWAPAHPRCRCFIVYEWAGVAG